MIAALSARAVWLTQPPVVEDMLAASPLSQLATWHDVDTEKSASAMAEVLAPAPIVDLQEAFRSTDLRGLYRDDGVHPNLEGQTLVTRAVLRAFAELVG